MAWHARRHDRGQSFTEYVILGVAVLIAVLGIQTYLGRGVQAVVKRSADDLLRVDEADMTGELTQQRGLPRPAELTSATSNIQSSGTQTVTWSGGGQAINGQTTVTNTSTERYLELEGSPHSSGGNDGDDAVPGHWRPIADGTYMWVGH